MAGNGGDRGAMLAVMAPLDVVEKLLTEECLAADRRQQEHTPPGGAIRRHSRGPPGRATLCQAQADRQAVAGVRRVSQFVRRRGQRSVGPGAGRRCLYARRSAGLQQYHCTALSDAGREARALLARQLAAPVDFVEEVRNLYRSGARAFLEVGPGARLTGMVSAILDGKPHAAVAVDASSGQRGGVADLARTLAQLAVLGHSIDLKRWDEGAGRHRSRPRSRR